MRIRDSLGFLAAFALLIPQQAEGQAPSLHTYFSWGYGWHNYATYGGGFADDLRPGGASEAHSFGRFPQGGTAQEGWGTGQAAFGYLTASSRAYATAHSTSFWNDASVRYSTETVFHDILTVLSDGQLSFGLLMNDVLSTSGNADPACGAGYSPHLGNHCVRAAARLSVWGAVNTGLEVGHTSLSGATSANSSSGFLNVYAGQVLEIRGSFMVGGTTCENYDGSGYCNITTGSYSTALGSGSARFFVDEQGGADYSSISGTQYMSSTQVTATPEPSSVLLLATGLYGIAAAARRHRKVGQPA